MINLFFIHVAVIFNNSKASEHFGFGVEYHFQRAGGTWAPGDVYYSKKLKY